MSIPASNFINLAYITSIGLGGSFLTKKATQATIWSWNQCVSEERKICQENQKKIVRVCEGIGGLLFAILAVREVFSENTIKNSKNRIETNLRDLEKEISNLFKMIFNNGRDSIHNFPLEMLTF